ncbi:MAG: peroxide stress protein YaaA, partial [Bacteroidales bacterium]|nr:peroxide stress protein YaaA [Bacteroidales bacterium]
MIVILSPAKTMDLKRGVVVERYSEPRLIERSMTLIKKLKKMGPQELQELMSISSKLAEENAIRFRDWHWPIAQDKGRQALFAFRGEVYNGFQADTLDEKGLDFAQDHVRILSGLHGILRPLDRIAPYRLEMGLSLSVGKHRDLYSYWGNDIIRVLQQDLRDQGDDILINL